ncbi:Hypothetical predicted protein [Olea europaea subsp. europaea]|uniref:Uncharacterized protein n=1 Tax=Olea europaea subsp. europaea TaxID=158383 RepID=A0A8S0S081_OLEEU|nr:Hypothetical predicted protein [Olea europaea subsp. europaea]
MIEWKRDNPYSPSHISPPNSKPFPTSPFPSPPFSINDNEITPSKSSLSPTSYKISEEEEEVSTVKSKIYQHRKSSNVAPIFPRHEATTMPNRRRRLFPSIHLK